MRLIEEKTGREIKIGSMVQDKHGTNYEVDWCPAPHKPASSGKMKVSTSMTPYYVSSYGCKWIEREDQGWVPPVDPPLPKKKIEHRLMEMLKERGYDPLIARGANGFWVITFIRENETLSITPESPICDQKWMDDPILPAAETGFAEWMKYLNSFFEAKYGIDSESFEDYNWFDEFDNGVSPGDAFEEWKCMNEADVLGG